jgi:hypothetical protein
MPANPQYAKVPVKSTPGGFQTASIFSGQVAPNLAACPGAVAGGSDVLLFSGAGRLDDILQHVQMASGQPVFFYDSAVPTSGGPFALSGHKIVGVLPGTWAGGIATTASGATAAPTSFVNPVFATRLPFQSGLCVNSRSGQPGFTVAWSPEPAQQ